MGRSRPRSAADVVERVVENLERAVRAPRSTLELCVLCLIAEGHLIIEDFPGVGKTVLAKSVARSLDLSFSRLQFTPDLLPTDVTGVNVFNQRSGEFEFRPGPVFANVLLVDEINRASPKTQSALLEAMQEAQVTIDGSTYALEQPFFVVATQNPIEYEGTYPLPEAQLDRFTARLSLGYPPSGEEARMLAEQTTAPPLDALEAVADRDELLAAIDAARAVYVEESVGEYVVTILRHTRESDAARARCEPASRDRAPADGEGPRGCAAARLRRARGRPGGRGRRALTSSDRRARGACGRRTGRGRDRACARRGPEPAMSAWRGGLGLGAVALAAAVATGSRPLGVVGIGFLFAAAVTWVWRWLAETPVTLSLEPTPAPATEGDRVRIVAELHRASRILLGSATARATVGRLGPRDWSFRGHGRTLRAEVDLGVLARGVHTVTDVEAAIGDLLGLVSVTPSVACEQATLVVRPRLTTLDGFFSDAGRLTGDGRRLLLRRSAGFDFHSVREYEQGESLRRVHWPTTARRGQLMVKELEETAHDGAVVLLDCDPRGAVGVPPDSSFDVAVRAAGSILQAHATRGRSATLVTTAQGHTVVRTADFEVGAAVTALAAAMPDARYPLARFLSSDGAVAGGAELTIVTAALDPAAFTAVLGAAARRLVSVVWIDAASFAARPTRADTGVLRLAANGVPVAVVRRGDDLGSVLSARTPAMAVADG